MKSIQKGKRKRAKKARLTSDPPSPLILEWIHDHLTGPLIDISSKIPETLLGGLGSALFTIYSVAVDAITELAEEMTARGVDFAKTIGLSLTTKLGEATMMQLTTLGAIKGGEIYVYEPPAPLAPLYDACTWFGRLFVDGINKYIMPTPPVTFEKASDAAGRYISLMLFLQIVPMLMGMVIDFVVDTFKGAAGGAAAAAGGGGGRGFQDLIRDLYYSLGFCWLTWTIFGGPFREGIMRPLEKHWRSQLRTRIISRAEADWMLGMRLIDISEYKALLSEGGYTDRTIEILADRAMKAALRDERTRLRTEILKDFTDGFDYEGLTRMDLLALDYLPEEVEWLIEEAKHEKERKHKRAVRDNLILAYRRDLIDLETLRVALAQIIVDPVIVEDIVVEEQIRKGIIPEEWKRAGGKA